MRIGAYMISCAERAAMREQTLGNLGRTDWNAPVSVILDRGLFESRLDRQTHTALEALRAGLEAGPEFILFLEDDLDFNRHLRHNLESWYPLRAARPHAQLFASLYNPNVSAMEQLPQHNAFIAHSGSVYGSQAYVVARATARYIVEHWDEVAGMQDIRMSRLAGRVAPVHYYSPSLVEHVGQQSAWGGHYHRAVDFDRDWRSNVMVPSYDREFFLNLRQGSLDSARVVVPLVLKLLKPRRVVDVGCASGAWLSVFAENGIEDLWGIDGDYVDPDLLLVPADRVLRRDLTAGFELDPRADLALSLEVAEHLPASAAGGFIASLTAIAPVILFSAAIPGQGGYCHINEQWPEYWMQLFAQHDFVPVDSIRPRIWNDPAVCFWYRQNILLYIHQPYLESRANLRKLRSPYPLALVHPELYLMKCR